MCLHEIWRVWKIHLSLFLVSLTPSALCYFIGGARFYGLWPQGHMGGRQSFLVAHNLVLSVLGIHERKELKITKVYLSLSFYDRRVASQKGNFLFKFLILLCGVISRTQRFGNSRHGLRFEYSDYLWLFLGSKKTGSWRNDRFSHPASMLLSSIISVKSMPKPSWRAT